MLENYHEEIFQENVKCLINKPSKEFPKSEKLAENGFTDFNVF